AQSQQLGQPAVQRELGGVAEGGGAGVGDGHQRFIGCGVEAGGVDLHVAQSAVLSEASGLLTVASFCQQVKTMTATTGRTRTLRSCRAALGDEFSGARWSKCS